MPNLVPATIAIVDDDVRMLESLGNLLESAGYSVRLCASAHALLHDVGLTGLHCLISDIGMPGMDGFGLQKLAAALRPDLPVILITALHDPTHPAASEPNNRGFFQKPFDGKDLLLAVAAAVAERG